MYVIKLSSYLSLCLYVHLSIYLFIYLSIYPSTRLPHLYTEEVRDSYLLHDDGGSGSSSNSSSSSDHHQQPKLASHVYAISGEAYHGVAHHGVNQTILVSGESGAGK